jgi:hypothetical protein
MSIVLALSELSRVRTVALVHNAGNLPLLWVVIRMTHDFGQAITFEEVQNLLCESI